MSFSELEASGQTSLEGDGFRVEWVSLGEGNFGDYDPEDPEDEEFLRFDVSRQGEDGQWEQIQDGSYCTLMPVDTSVEILRAALVYILREIGGGFNVKRRLEQLSWLAPEDFPKPQI
jgi:hypothetical protein